MLETSPINAKFVQSSLTTKLTWDATCAYTRERSPSHAMFAGKASSERTEWSNTRTLTRRRPRWAEAWCDNKLTRADTCTGPGAKCRVTITCDFRSTWQHVTSGPRDSLARVCSPLTRYHESQWREPGEFHISSDPFLNKTSLTCHVSTCLFQSDLALMPYANKWVTRAIWNNEFNKLLYRKWFCRSFVKI